MEHFDLPFSPAFPPTDLSLIQRARADGEVAVRARGELYELYRFPLTAFLAVRFRLSPERSADRFQDIFNDKFISKENLLKSWNPKRGRFRTHLCTAFKNAVIDALEKERRRPGQRLDVDVALDGAVDAELDAHADDTFRVAWAVNVIARAVETLRVKCRARNEDGMWRVFELFLWQPALHGSESPSLQDVAERMGLADRKKVHNLSVTAVNRIKAALREALADEAEDDETLELDLESLKQVLAESSREVLAELARIQNFAAPPVEGSGEPSGVMASVSALLQARPERLAGLMDLASKHNQAWSDADLRALLAHHITTPMTFDLGVMDAAAEGRLRALAEAHGLVIKSLKDLFEHPHPPLELLRFIKDFAKAHLLHPDSPLPAPVARVLYYAAVACALARQGTGISSANAVTQAEWFQWGKSQPWADESLRALFAEGLRRLNTT